MPQLADCPPSIDRRRGARMRLRPMYTSVRLGVVTAKQGAGAAGGPGRAEGHAYDISATGVRIELDEPLAVGDEVDLRIDLPGATGDIGAKAKVVWVAQASDDPGPRRMALRFTMFRSMLDRHRLTACIGRHHDVGDQLAAA